MKRYASFEWIRVWRFVLRAATCGMLLLGMAKTAVTQSPPGWSRGQQTLNISYNECLRRIQVALQGQAYRIDALQGDFGVGYKGVNTAVIMCAPVNNTTEIVNIVVASNGPGGGVERQQLQALMQSGSAPPPVYIPPVSGPGPAYGTQIKWTDYPLTAARGHDVNGQRSTFTCPPGGDPGIANRAGRITGTDVYSDDSPICVAAVHAGLIGFAGGGTVTVQVMRPGPTQLVGSTRNGVTSLSNNNGAYPTLGAYTFVR